MKQGKCQKLKVRKDLLEIKKKKKSIIKVCRREERKQGE